MGGSTSKHERRSWEDFQGSFFERRGMRSKREEIDERDMMVYALKEAEMEWKKERKRLREEVKRLRKKVEENEEAMSDLAGREWVVEQMFEERAVKDEAVERWKQLYLAIKNELDDLIQRTYGEGLHWRPKEDDAKTIKELRQELEVKEGTIETLKEKIALMEKQQHGKEREIDILRQSLRIIGSDSSETKKKKKKKKKASPTTSKSLPILKNRCVDSR